MDEIAPAPATLPEGTRVYAIGDIHGCLTKLVALHGLIAADLAARPVPDSVLLHLGDYVDRGPDSAGVVQLLAGEVAPAVTRRADLCGNHEVMMNAALSSDMELADLWLRNGGEATLRSYGSSPDLLPDDWLGHIPPRHRDWLGARALTHREGGYLFVHAGIRPGRRLRQQTADDLLWIREPFLSSQDRHALVVVHGHTPAMAPSLRANRIGIDTGACMGGALTCLVLEADRMGFLAA